MPYSQIGRIGSADTTPEVKLRKALWRRGVRYRKGTRVAGIRPDLVLPRMNVVVFVDGCFWHGCPQHYVKPLSNDAFWASKLRANVERDIKQTAKLQAAGWRVCRFWEHEVMADVEECADQVLDRTPGHSHLRTSMRVICIEPLAQSNHDSWTLIDLHGVTAPELRAKRRSSLR